MTSQLPKAWSAMHKFLQSEKSSGYRPYLVYMGMTFTVGLPLCSFEATRLIGELLIVVPACIFILHFIVMSFYNENFCRSEKHVETMKQIDLLGDNLSGEKELTNATPLLPPPNESES